MPIATERISEFLRIVEGPQQTEGYIPCWLVDSAGKRIPKEKGQGFRSANFRGGPRQYPGMFAVMGASGVTIGTGIDLGQTNAATLLRIGVDEAVVNSLAPYLGRRKADAITALFRAPLTVSRAVADILDHCMHSHHANLIEARYDRDTWAGAYAALPWQAQVAIFSILFQRGTGSPKNYPNTWAAFLRQDWHEVAMKLCNATLWDDYQNRRRQEGELLKKIA